MGEGGSPAGEAAHLTGHVCGSIRASDKWVALGVQVVAGITENGLAPGREAGLVGQQIPMTSAPSYLTPNSKSGSSSYRRDEGEGVGLRH